MEKRRRERINRSLEELKRLVLEAQNRDVSLLCQQQNIDTRSIQLTSLFFKLKLFVLSRYKFMNSLKLLVLSNCMHEWVFFDLCRVCEWTGFIFTPGMRCIGVANFFLIKNVWTVFYVTSVSLRKPIVTYYRESLIRLDILQFMQSDLVIISFSHVSVKHNFSHFRVNVHNFEFLLPMVCQLTIASLNCIGYVTAVFVSSKGSINVPYCNRICRVQDTQSLKRPIS